MKKHIILSVLLFLAVYNLCGQNNRIYYYKIIETIDTGKNTRQKYYDSGIGTRHTFITFTGNSCYASDENGRIKERRCPLDIGPFPGVDGPFIYQGERNSLYVYMLTRSGINPANMKFNWQYFLYFSKDYNRLNFRIFNVDNNTWDNIIYVFERADPPIKIDPLTETPEFLY